MSNVATLTSVPEVQNNASSITSISHLGDDERNDQRTEADRFLKFDFSYSVRHRRDVLIAGDALAILIVCLLSWAVAGVIRQVFGFQFAAGIAGQGVELPAILLLVSFALVTGYSRVWGHYTRFKSFWTEMRDIVKIIAYVAATHAILLFAFKHDFSRAWLVSFWIALLFSLPSARLLARRMMKSHGTWFTPTIVIGAGANAKRVGEALESDSYLAHRVVGYINPSDTLSLDKLARRRQRLGSGGEKTLRSCAPDYPHLVFAFDTMDELQDNRALIDRLAISSNCVTLAPPVFGFPLYNTEVLNIFKKDTVLLRFHNNLQKPWARVAKRAFDVVVASCAVFVLAPVLLLCYLMVRSDGGPALFGHRRRGEGDRPFQCLKFRTMVMDSDEVLSRLLASSKIARAEWEKDFKLKNDPRITRFGRFLRNTSLDELPQLFNVIKGDMSLVGPRPIVSEEVDRYAANYEYYKQAKPGITGLWQVSGRNDVSYGERIGLDAWYVKNWSFWNDLVILLKTIPIVLRRTGAY